MGWEPGRRTAPLPPPTERRVWVLVKNARSATAALRAHPLGTECIVRLGGEMLWSRVLRPQDGITAEDEAETARQAFLGRGWEPAE